MADEILRGLFKELLDSRRRTLQGSGSTSSAGPSSSTSSDNASNQNLLLSFLQSSIESGSFSSRSREDRRNEDRPFGRRTARNRFDYDEDEFYQSSRRGPRSFRNRDNDSPERQYSSKLTKPQFRIREGRHYIDIMNIFDQSSLHLRKKG